MLLAAARGAGVERGDRVRIDSTVTATHILSPSDTGRARGPAGERLAGQRSN